MALFETATKHLPFAEKDGEPPLNDGGPFPPLKEHCDSREVAGLSRVKSHKTSLLARQSRRVISNPKLISFLSF